MAKDKKNGNASSVKGKKSTYKVGDFTFKNFYDLICGTFL